MIVGSQYAWAEGASLAAGARLVTTIEYMPIKSGTQQCDIAPINTLYFSVRVLFRINALFLSLGRRVGIRALCLNLLCILTK